MTCEWALSTVRQEKSLKGPSSHQSLTVRKAADEDDDKPR